MDFLPDADQRALITATSEFVSSRLALRDGLSVLDDTRWQEIAELGWLGLGADPEVGGAGAALVDETLVFREIGRGLVPGPILTTLASARLAQWAGSPELAAALIDGRHRVSRAVAAAGGEGRLLLTDPDGAGLVLFVGADSAGLYDRPDDVALTPGLEDSTAMGRTAIGGLGTARVKTREQYIVAAVRRVLTILTSAQLAGIARATCDLATVQAKNRVQFGKPIGAFQAIKHRCADMATAAMAAENIVFFAALTAPTGLAGSDYNALAAAALCRRAAFANARTSIQIHGAMGFSVENSAHRFVKRTHTLCTVEDLGRAAAQLGSLPRTDPLEEP
jgi:alkylation response protein AidB-like acyl-CoA dehydrogenase